MSKASTPPDRNGTATIFALSLYSETKDQVQKYKVIYSIIAWAMLPTVEFV
jgi:hypothetical protein